MIYKITILTLILLACSTSYKVSKNNSLLYTSLNLNLVSDEKHNKKSTIFFLPDSIKKIIIREIPKHLNDSEKTLKLHQFILSDQFMGFKYNAQKTQSAIRSWELKEGNCLSFTILYHSLADFLDLKVQFNDVQSLPVWEEQSNNNYTMFRHVNTIVEIEDGQQLIIDLNISNYNISDPQTEISESNIIAQYYNNIAMGYLNIGKLNVAMDFFKQSINADPTIDFVWSNLGILLKKQEKYDLAELSFAKALELNRKNPSTLNNVSLLFKKLGNLEKYNHFKSLSDDYRSKNPYYLYLKAQSSLKRNLLEDALEFISKAINQKHSDHRFYHTRAKIYTRLQQKDKAILDLTKASILSKENPNQTRRYLDKLDHLQN